MNYYSSFVLLTNPRNQKPHLSSRPSGSASRVLARLKRCYRIEERSVRGSSRRRLRRKLEFSLSLPTPIARNERRHAVIQNTLRSFVESKQSSWHKYTDGLQYMFNTRSNVEIGIPQYEIVFGLKPRSLHNTTPFLE